MRGRLVDVLLVVGLVLVAGAIVWTLLSLGSDRGPGPDAGPTVEAPADPEDAPGDAIVPVAPGAAGDDAPAAADADGSADAPDDAADQEAPAAADGDEAGPDDAAPDEADADDAEDAPVADEAGPDPDVPAAEAGPLPAAGPIELGRIGFSYVTGGAGACGIVLEPWTHVAVSRELLEELGCGAEVRIALDDETAGRTAFDAVVADTMNPAFSRTVNVYVGEDEPALEFGLTTGTLER